MIISLNIYASVYQIFTDLMRENDILKKGDDR